MILKHVSGCICDSLTVDDVETIDMKKEDVKDVIKTLIDREDDLGTLQSVLIDLIDTRGDYKMDDEPCECCGDYISTATLVI